MFLFTWLIDFMTAFIETLNGYLGSYGLAIIVFTLIIRVLLYPLTAKQTRSMKGMKDLQPKMEEIKEKYEDDKETQQKKMMELYKENNVNPLAGCLPLILQMAILIPLFHTIRDMGIEEGFLWIETLSESDVPLVLLNAGAVFLQSYLTQKNSGGEKAGGMMMWIMPLFILLIGFQLPAGVLIYFVTSTLIHALQHYKLSQESDEGAVENG
ncbi:MAG: YidC/Oxa1 family membrane protein insertase [Bacillota bacterium]